MNPYSGKLRCMPLTYFVFKTSSWGQDGVFKLLSFYDNLCPGLLTQSKGESEV
jgi:hypothetical protein